MIHYGKIYHQGNNNRIDAYLKHKIFHSIPNKNSLINFSYGHADLEDNFLIFLLVLNQKTLKGLGNIF